MQARTNGGPLPVLSEQASEGAGNLEQPHDRSSLHMGCVPSTALSAVSTHQVSERIPRGLIQMPNPVSNATNTSMIRYIASPDDELGQEPTMLQDESASSEVTNRQVVKRRLTRCCTQVKSHRTTFVIGLVGSCALLLLATPVAAQTSGPVGSDICGTPLANTINQAAPLIVGLLMIGGAILSYILHNASGFPKDPQVVQSVKNWRNRAAFASVTTPLFAVVMEMFIGFTGVGLANCVDIVPFF